MHILQLFYIIIFHLHAVVAVTTNSIFDFMFKMKYNVFIFNFKNNFNIR